MCQTQIQNLKSVDFIDVLFVSWFHLREVFIQYFHLIQSRKTMIKPIFSYTLA